MPHQGPPDADPLYQREHLRTKPQPAQPPQYSTDPTVTSHVARPSTSSSFSSSSSIGSAVFSCTTGHAVGTAEGGTFQAPGSACSPTSLASADFHDCDATRNQSYSGPRDDFENSITDSSDCQQLRDTTATPPCNVSDVHAPRQFSLSLARHTLERLSLSPIAPSSPAELWYAVNSEFFRRLEVLVNRSTIDDDPWLLNPECTCIADQHWLPTIRNKILIEGQYLKHRVTERTPLKQSCLNDVTYVDSSTWTYLCSVAPFDIVIPRSVLPAQLLGIVTEGTAYQQLFRVEQQPLCLWTVFCPSHVPTAGLQGTPTAFFFSRKDTLSTLFLQAFVSMGASSKSVFFKAEHFLPFDKMPKTHRDVGKWIPFAMPHLASSQMLGEEELFADAPSWVIHILAQSDQSVSKHSKQLMPDLNVSTESRTVASPAAPLPCLSSGGLVGFQNLGNTCFMNSALQCLSHTMPLTDYFLSKKYLKDLNYINPLGMKGRLATAYAQLIESAWDTRRLHDGVVTPRDLKVVVGQFAPQFIGYQQQDSQELTAFLLDGFHEDLNRVIDKPYLECVEGDDETDDNHVARESWKRHKLRNDSFIVDTFQGLYRSRLECPECRKVSVVFDPYMYLSLPVPNITDLPVFFTFVFPFLDTAATLPIAALRLAFTIRSDQTTYQQLKSAVARQIVAFRTALTETSSTIRAAYGIPDSVPLQTLARIFDSTLLREIEHTDDPAALHHIIKQRLVLVQYQKSDGMSSGTPLHFMKSTSVYAMSRGHIEYGFSAKRNVDELFGFLVTDPNLVSLAEDESQKPSNHRKPGNVENTDVSLLSAEENPQELSVAAAAQACSDTIPETTKTNSHYRSREVPCVLLLAHMAPHSSPYLQPELYFPSFHLVDLDSLSCSAVYDLIQKLKTYCENSAECSASFTTDTELAGYKTTVIPNRADQLLKDVLCFSTIPPTLVLNVEWDKIPAPCPIIRNERQEQDMLQLCRAPSPPIPVSLADCLKEFVKEEQLEVDNMWYCNRCKMHRQAKKKIDIWSVPEILVIHLKRFSHTSRHFRAKNSAHVLFDPTRPLDLRPFVQAGTQRLFESGKVDPNGSNNPLNYELFGVSHHSGSLSVGHYTATVKCQFSDLVTKQNQSQWMEFNDSHVSLISDTSKVCDSTAYLLFYQRVPSKTDAKIASQQP